MFHVAEGRTRAARAREACGVSETRVYRPVKGPRDEGEGTLFTECGHSSRLEGGAPGALRELIDRQLVVLTSSCTALEFLAFRSIRAATYISHALTVRQVGNSSTAFIIHYPMRMYDCICSNT